MTEVCLGYCIKMELNYIFSIWLFYLNIHNISVILVCRMRHFADDSYDHMHHHIFLFEVVDDVYFAFWLRQIRLFFVYHKFLFFYFIVNFSWTIAFTWVREICHMYTRFFSYILFLKNNKVEGLFLCDCALDCFLILSTLFDKPVKSKGKLHLLGLKRRSFLFRFREFKHPFTNQVKNKNQELSRM